jgi:O-antigen ligase
MGRLIFYVFLAVLVLVPFPFASVKDWAWGLLAALSGALLLAWRATVSTADIRAVPLHAKTPLCAMFTLVVLWSLLQTSGWTPAAWDHPMWKDASALLGVPLHGAVSINPARSFGDALRITSYGTIFWLAMHYGRDSRNAKLIVQTIAMASVVYAIYGLLEYFSGSFTILWYRREAYWYDLTSTFVNKNNYATFAGMGWLSALALFYQAFRQKVGNQRVRSEYLRHCVAFAEQTGWKFILGLLILLGALLYSHSRAGFGSSMIGTMGLCLALAANRNADPKFARRFSLVCLLLTGLFFLASGKVLDERIAATSLTAEERPRVYELTLLAIANQPLLGSGLDSFEDIFRFYRASDIRELFNFAHNSYLEATLALGIPVAAILLLCFLWIFVITLRGAYQRRKDEIYPALGVGATVLVALHSLLDFSIQIPAVAVTYAALAGVGYAQSWSTNQRGGSGR